MASHLFQETPYIPRATLFVSPEVISVKVSPDSKVLAYVKGEPSGVMNLFISKVSECHNGKALKQLTYFSTPEIYRFFWTDDSKHIVFLQDINGSKAYHLYSVNIESEELTNHTENFKETTAKILKVSGHRVAIGLNDRNPSYHDLFILDLNNKSLTKIFKNDRFSRFTFDEYLNVAFKEEVHENGSIDIFRDESIYMHIPAEDAFHSRILRVQDSVLYYLDSRNSDTTWLKSVHLKTGKETQLAHDSKSDIGDVVFVENNPYMYSTTWLKKEWHSFGSGSFDFLQKELGTCFEIISQSRSL